MLFGYRRFWIVSDDVGHRIERLRGCEWPDSAVPLTIADAVGAEFRVASFGGGDAKGGPESGWIDELGPGVFKSEIGQLETPGDETYFFTGIGEPVFGGLGFE